MFRRFGQIVAILTVLAATVYAQCAASCALVSATPEPQTQDHSCCPHQGSDHNKAPGHSCNTASSHSTDVRLDGGGIGWPSVDFGAVQRADLIAPSFAEPALATIADVATVTRPPSLTPLRL